MSDQEKQSAKAVGPSCDQQQNAPKQRAGGDVLCDRDTLLLAHDFLVTSGIDPAGALCQRLRDIACDVPADKVTPDDGRGCVSVHALREKWDRLKLIGKEPTEQAVPEVQVPRLDATMQTLGKFGSALQRELAELRTVMHATQSLRFEEAAKKAVELLQTLPIVVQLTAGEQIQRAIGVQALPKEQNDQQRERFGFVCRRIVQESIEQILRRFPT